MSRVGRRIIKIPSEVNLRIDNNEIFVKGPLGDLNYKFDTKLVKLIQKDGDLVVERFNDLRKSKMIHGTTNSNINNMVIGVTKGYKKELKIFGVGYNVKLVGAKLEFSLGLSHKVEMEIPSGLKVELPSQTELTISGIDKQKVGLFASIIKKLRPTEVYGGKGIRYKNEQIRRKAGKTQK